MSYQGHRDPVSRIGIFTQRMAELCAEAGLPTPDRSEHDGEHLAFLWDRPQFCIAVSLRHSNVLGITADDVRSAWLRKHGGDWRARLERGALR